RGLAVINGLTLTSDDKQTIYIESKKHKSDKPALPIDSDNVKYESRGSQIISKRNFGNICDIFQWGEGLALGIEHVYERYIVNKITDTRKIVVKNTYGGVLENYVLNGNFDSSAYWNIGTNWIVGSGHAIHSSGASGSITQNDVFEIGKTYVIELQMQNNSSNQKWDYGIKIRAGDNYTQPILDSGIYSFVLKATGTTLNILAAPNFSGWVDNIKVYDVNVLDIDILSNIDYDGKEFWIAGFNETNDGELIELEIWEKA
ncbi:MAG: hypothetical protein KGY74_05255, partial [Candidatus Cloacimonetes bacterium]|nr:hypothetical protein [Candidatus Cloacimonadota bacterium]